MSKYDIKSVEGEKVGEAELSSDVFGIEPNIPCMHQVVTCQDACLRQGTHSTKNRHEVSGGGRKPWRQKGTGHARQGSIRAGQWTGGGVIFGPTPRDHSKKVNAKMVKLAMRSALSAKVADSELVLVDALSFEKPSAKQAAKLIKDLGLEGKRVTVVLPDDDANGYLSFRNLEKVIVLGCSELNTRFIIDNAALVMTPDTAKHFEEVLA